MHGFKRIRGRARNVEAVGHRHHGEVFQRAHLLRQFFAYPDHVVAGPHVIDLCPLGPLRLKQLIHAVKGDAPVIADDAAATIGVGLRDARTRFSISVLISVLRFSPRSSGAQQSGAL